MQRGRPSAGLGGGVLEEIRDVHGWRRRGGQEKKRKRKEKKKNSGGGRGERKREGPDSERKRKRYASKIRFISIRFTSHDRDLHPTWSDRDQLSLADHLPPRRPPIALRPTTRLLSRPRQPFMSARPRFSARLAVMNGLSCPGGPLSTSYQRVTNPPTCHLCSAWKVAQCTCPDGAYGTHPRSSSADKISHPVAAWSDRISTAHVYLCSYFRVPGHSPTITQTPDGSHTSLLPNMVILPHSRCGDAVAP